MYSDVCCMCVCCVLKTIELRLPLTQSAINVFPSYVDTFPASRISAYYKVVGMEKHMLSLILILQ
jgi:hypothetical protein